jgi:hypothetical protein
MTFDHSHRARARSVPRATNAQVAPMHVARLPSLQARGSTAYGSLQHFDRAVRDVARTSVTWRRDCRDLPAWLRRQ